mmetsp:Transcript_25376/g.37541  ORF Transcript_25376/g.37541 Transcript_25376/m.37541 type:complete len:86 (+) Transcript_25376:141-398(+)
MTPHSSSSSLFWVPCRSAHGSPRTPKRPQLGVQPTVPLVLRCQQDATHLADHAKYGWMDDAKSNEVKISNTVVSVLGYEEPGRLG